MYDVIERKVAETDFWGNTTAYTYDSRKLVHGDNAGQRYLKFGHKDYYDANGNVIKTEQTPQAEGEETKWFFLCLHHLMQKTTAMRS